MKKILASLAMWALLPAIAFAAFNDVTLTTSTVLSVNSVTLNVTGSSAVVQSIVVRSGNFDVTLLPGSSLTVTATTNANMDVVLPGPMTSTLTCATGGSELVLSGATAASLVTVTPGGTCGATAGSGGSGGSSGGGGGIFSGGGGGGGGGGSVTFPAIPATPAVPGVSPAVPATPAIPASFSKDFGIGATGDDVIALQTFLEAKGFLVIPSGTGKGLFGGLTKKALQAYQVSVGINPTGYLGPKTRAAIAGSQATSPSQTSGVLSGEFGNGATGADVVTLQNFLEAKGFLTMPEGVPKGTFGNLTKKALQAYQKSVDINPTGYVGPKTLAAINASL